MFYPAGFNCKDEQSDSEEPSAQLAYIEPNIVTEQPFVSFSFSPPTLLSYEREPIGHRDKRVGPVCDPRKRIIELTSDTTKAMTLLIRSSKFHIYNSKMRYVERAVGDTHLC